MTSKPANTFPLGSRTAVRDADQPYNRYKQGNHGGNYYIVTVVVFSVLFLRAGCKYRCSGCGIGVQCGTSSQLSSTRGLLKKRDTKYRFRPVTHAAFASLCHLVLLSQKGVLFVVLSTTAVSAMKNRRFVIDDGSETKKNIYRVAHVDTSGTLLPSTHM